jgi:hypothetical protein
MGTKRIYMFETNRHPMQLLSVVKIPTRPIALALSECYLAVVDEKRVYLYQMLARNTKKFMVNQVYSIRVPNLDAPMTIALTPQGKSKPLVAVLGAELHLIHPAHALSEKRQDFFKANIDAKDISISKKSIVKSTIASDCQKSEFERQSRSHKWVLTSPGSSIGISFPIKFDIYGLQLNVSTLGAQNQSSQRSVYLGSAWNNEDPHELARRRINGLPDGVNLQSQTFSPDALFQHYQSKIDTKTVAQAVIRWTPQHFDTVNLDIEDALHIWDSYYILTDSATGLVQIVSIAPYETKLILYHRPATSEERCRSHCGYVVYHGTQPGKLSDGYIAFTPSNGRLKVLPITRITFATRAGSNTDICCRVGWELVMGCRDIAVGPGEILDMFAGANKITIVYDDRVVVVGIWTYQNITCRKNDNEEWSIDKKGRVLKYCNNKNVGAGRKSWYSGFCSISDNNQPCIIV